MVASPTFSLPEYIGGTRNWYVHDYMPVMDSVHRVNVGIIGMLRGELSQQLSLAYLLSSASWIRDSSFTLYALIRLGFTHEANCLFYDQSITLSLTVQ